MNGKGSKQRPTNKAKFDENYDAIFGQKKEVEPERFMTFADTVGSYICQCSACGVASIIDLKEEPKSNLFCPVCGTKQ